MHFTACRTKAVFCLRIWIEAYSIIGLNGVMHANLKEKKILVVDNDRWIRSSLSYYFRKKAGACVAVETAEEALERITAEPFDIILCDYKLPGMSGIELLRRVHSINPAMCRILITAYAGDEVAESASACAIDDCIAKPFSSLDIERSLEKHCLK